MIEADLVVKNARQIVTCAGFSQRPKIKDELLDLAVIENGAVAVQGEKIVWVGAADALEQDVRFTSEVDIVDAAGQVVLPGFVDPHTHIVYGGSREREFPLRLKGTPYLEILKGGGGILSSVRSTRAISEEELYCQSKKRADRLLEQGITTVEIKSGYGLDTKTELSQLRVIQRLKEEHPLDVIPTFLGAHALPPEYSSRSDLFIDLVVDEMLPAVVEANLAQFCDVFCEEGVFDVQQSRRVLKAAGRLGLRVKLHADELAPIGGAELAAELGAVSADHLLCVSNGGIRKMAEKGVIGVLLPATSFNLATGEYAPARKMIESGLPVALSTDCNPGSSPTESAQLVLTLACLYLKMLPEEAINAATINAAHALSQGEHIGSLEPGKQADLVFFDAPNYTYIPYYFGGNHVTKVIKRGKVVLERETASY